MRRHPYPYPICLVLVVGASSWSGALSFAPFDSARRPSAVPPSEKTRFPHPKPLANSVDRRLSSTLMLSKDNNDPGLGLQNRAGLFTVTMAFCGATLGPFLDSYHSAFGVLQYEQPITATLWGTLTQPALTTAWWVPELFGLAGIIIGWLYVLLDTVFETTTAQTSPNPPKILVGVAAFTFQYWLSGVLFYMGVGRTTSLLAMSMLAVIGFVVLDKTLSGFLTSLATAVGGPLVETGLLSMLTGHGGYQYLDKGEFGLFPNWIAPGGLQSCHTVYFLGGPAVGNLARGIWNVLASNDVRRTESSESTAISYPDRPHCAECNDSRAVGCPNCDSQGYYVTYGQKVHCSCCRGRGLVICRGCFSMYEEDPNDIEAIREIIDNMPD